MERSVSKYSKPGNVFQLYVFITSPYFHQKGGRKTLVTPRNSLINFSNNKLEAFARFLKHRPSAQILVSMSHQNWLLQFHSILSEITVSSVLTLSSRLWFSNQKVSFLWPSISIETSKLKRNVSPSYGVEQFQCLKALVGRWARTVKRHCRTAFLSIDSCTHCTNFIILNAVADSSAVSSSIPQLLSAHSSPPTDAVISILTRPINVAHHNFDIPQ